MNRNYRVAFFFCAALLTAGLTGCGGSPEPTRFRAETGDSRSASVELTTQINIEAGMKMAITTTERLRLKLEATEVAPDDGPITFTTTIDNYDIDLDMSLNGQDMSGMMPIKAMIGDSLRAVTGKTFTLKVSPRGEVIAVEDAEEIQRAFLEASKVPMGQMDENNALSGSQLKRYCSYLFCPYPEEPITEESRWESTLQLDGEMDADITSTWFLKESNEAFHIYGANSQMESVPGGSMLGGMPGTGEIKGAGEVTREVEISSGWVILSTEDMTLSGHMTMEGLPIPGGGEIDLNGSLKVEAKTY